MVIKIIKIIVFTPKKIILFFKNLFFFSETENLLEWLPRVAHLDPIEFGGLHEGDILQQDFEKNEIENYVSFLFLFFFNFHISFIFNF